MAGQATQETREQVRACIKSVEHNKNTAGSKIPTMNSKTVNKQ